MAHLRSHRTALLFGLLVLLTLAFASTPANAATESYSGEWTKVESGCWALDAEDGTRWSVAPVSGLDLHPHAGWSVELLAESSGESGCAGPALSVSGVVHQSAPAPVVTVPASSGALAAFPSWTVIASAAGIILLLGVVVTDEQVQYQSLAAATRPFSRKKTRSDEAAFLRGRIAGFLSANQGLHFSGIAAAFDMGNHQAAHHLSVLEREGHVWKRRDGRRLRFYTADIPQGADSRELPAPREPPAPESLPARLLEYIEALEHGAVSGAAQKQIAAHLETSQQLVSHHLRMMERSGWVHRSGRGRGKRLQLTEAGLEALSQVRAQLGGVASGVDYLTE